MQDCKVIPLFNNKYAITDNGQVIDLYRNRNRKSHINKDGYLRITLYGKYKEGVKHYFIHYLVMLAWVGNKPKNYEVNHIDGNKLNNSLNNLEYIPLSDNRKHMYRVCGRARSKIDTHDKDTVSDILEFKRMGYSQQKIATYMGLSRSTVKTILDRNKIDISYNI